MKNDKVASLGTPGSVSLLVTFAVLSIAIFSVLILSTCLSDKKRAETTFEYTDRYYAADMQAQTEIAKLRKEGQTGQQEFTVPAGDGMELQVSVLITRNDVIVKKWKLANTDEWTSESSMQLIG